jgi:NTP-dependent ternary system trypsin peptidase co-occuring protein
LPRDDDGVNERIFGVAVLLQLPLGEGFDGTDVLVEADRNDIAGGLTLAAAEPGKAVARATESLSQSLERLEPLLRTVKDTLAAGAPNHFSVEFGLKFGGETGLIIAKGTAEVNMTITMSWGPG